MISRPALAYEVLADTQAVYATKKSTFETNQKVRAEDPFRPVIDYYYY